MAAEEELELEERDIFDVGHKPASSLDTTKEEPAGEAGTASSSDDDTTSSTNQPAASRVPGPPRPMISRKIRRSLDQTEARFIRTLSRDLDEEEEGDDSDDAAGLSWLASANAKQGKHVFGVQSLPAAHVKMGSSAPINIPAQERRRRGDPVTEAERQPATFQPPHMLSQQEEDRLGRSAKSFAGQLATPSVKRSRLQQRNAILRSTGFLENVPAPSLGTIRETQPQNVRQSHLSNFSALSTALGVSPSPTPPAPLTQSLSQQLHQNVEPAPLA
ncbi:hypothetical protein WJX84_009548 [Apatococcus fuscideae]|uniref:Uncharacterized protein n=1 Tax=Apatococcus fuscideae TaxID=2026836 RepID=A0AAW1S4Y0_9CHLO